MTKIIKFGAEGITKGNMAGRKRKIIIYLTG
jgi:hypothetical protein